MICYRGTKDINLKQTVVALGKFDGLHRGHQRLFEELKAYKEKWGYQTVVFTFDFHPSGLFSGKPQPLIYTGDERRKIVETMGIDVLIEYPFTQETAHMQPEEFVRDVLVGRLDAKAIVVGDDFHFGYQRSGDVNFLKARSKEYGYVVDDCQKVCHNGEIISATMIRENIAKGDMVLTTELLGRPYSITGTVIAGYANGRTVNMPTANLAPEAGKLLPPEGVYASMVEIEGEKYYGLTNVGRNPTISDRNELKVETYVLDFNKNIYGMGICVELYCRLRSEKKFANLMELKAQVELDKKEAEKFFGL